MNNRVRWESPLTGAEPHQVAAEGQGDYTEAAQKEERPNQRTEEVPMAGTRRGAGQTKRPCRHCPKENADGKKHHSCRGANDPESGSSHSLRQRKGTLSYLRLLGLPPRTVTPLGTPDITGVVDPPEVTRDA